MPKPPKKPPTPREPIPPGSSVLALDVSSHAAGLALIRVGETGPKVDALKLIKPPAAWDEFRRVDLIVDRTVEFLDRLKWVEVAILEWVDGIKWPSRKYAKSLAISLDRTKSAQAHVRQALKPFVGRIETVSATEWSRRVKKEDRAERLKADHWRLATFKGDNGLDVADALGIGLWRVEASK